jgi:hypothetical protein
MSTVWTGGVVSVFESVMILRFLAGGSFGKGFGI